MILASEPGEVDMDPFLGEIRLVAFSFAPQGWALCEGQLLPINQNTALFSLLGTMYGGDGRTTFALPDLRGRVPLGAGTGASGTAYAVGESGGEEAVSLAVGQLPSHGHSVAAAGGAATKSNPSQSFPAGAKAYGTTHNVKMSGSMIGKSGSGKPHDNRQPFLGLTFIIALQGIFPSRP
jgi:microcystin-dependent protein